MQNHDVVLFKQFRKFATVTKCQMPLGLFMQLSTTNKYVKFCIKIPCGCSENGKQRQGILFPPHPII